MLGPMFIGLVLMAVIGIGALFMGSTGSEEAMVQRCPQCGRNALRRKMKDQFSGPRGWKCTECGNDKDEFGNQL